MVSSELRKLLNSKLTLLLMTLLLLTNGLITWKQQLPGTQSYTNIRSEHIRTLYAALPRDSKQALAALEQQEELLRQAIYEETFQEAPITDQGPLLTGDLYSERSLFSALMSRVEPVAGYITMLEEIRDNSETLLLTGRYGPNTFAYKNVIRSRQVYDRLWNTQPRLLYTGGVELLPGKGITEVMVALMCLLISLELIYSERSQGTLCLCKPVCKGGLPLILSKALAALIFGSLGTLLFYGSNLVVGLIRCGPVDPGAPIQSVFGMIRSPLRICIGTYILLFLGVKLLWTGAVLGLAFTAAYMGRKLWQCMGLFLLMGGICFLRPDSILNPLAQGSSTELFGTYWNVNVLGLPVSNLAAAVGLLLWITLTAWGAAVILHVKKAPTIPEATGRRSRRATLSLSLFSHEAWKLLIMNGALWILLSLIPVQAWIYSGFDTYIPPAERLYIQYSQRLSGEPNGEKEAFLIQEEARFARLYEELESYGNALAHGELNENAYSALTAAITRKLESEPIFHRARDQYRAMAAEGLDYVCLSPYEGLLGREGKKALLRQTLLLLLALTMGLSGSYGTEQETGMHQLLHTAEREPHSNRRKTLLALLYSLATAVAVYAPQIIALSHQYGFTGLLSPGRSVHLFSLTLGTVGTTLLLYGVLLAALSAAIALLILYLSHRTKHTLHTCLLSMTLLLPLPLLTLLLL